MLFTRTGIIALLLNATAVLAQPVDTAYLLPEATVVAPSLRYDPAGRSSQSWDAATLATYTGQNLPELLERESGVFIKSYGLGSSATSSIRGGSATQTAVTWNGLPLQSPMLGQLDFSLMPLGLVDEASLQYGSRSSAWGSGAVGGIIHLHNQQPTEMGLHTNWNARLGSFGRLHQQLGISFKEEQWAARSRVFYHKARNDFLYRVAPGQPEQRMENAALKQAGLLQELYWHSKKWGQFSLQCWAQQTDRELPPTTVQSRSLATQNDEFLRTALSWKKAYHKNTWNARLGVFQEKLDYRDEQILLKSVSRFTTVMGEVESSWHLSGQQRLQFSLSNFWTSAQSDGYGAPPTQNRTALMGAIQQYWKGWQFQFDIRASVVDGQWIPLTPSLGVEGRLLPWLQAKGSLSRSYRLPTLNDLYWQPGGSPDLQAEQGWSQEAGLVVQPMEEKQLLSYTLTAFNRNIDNWILWHLEEGNAFWSASNITKVWSRGLEQRLNARFSTAKVSGDVSIGYDYIRSTNEVGLQNPDLAAGEQLIYTPEHRGFGRLQLNYEQWGLQYQHWITGPVRGNNVEQLPGYQLGSLNIMYKQSGSDWHSRFFLQIENIWNEHYRVIERRPMPGRHFHFGIQLNL